MNAAIFFTLLGITALFQVADDLLTWSPLPPEDQHLHRFRLVATAVGGAAFMVFAFLVAGSPPPPNGTLWQVAGWFAAGTLALSAYGLVRDLVVRMRQRAG